MAKIASDDGKVDEAGGTIEARVTCRHMFCGASTISERQPRAP